MSALWHWQTISLAFPCKVLIVPSTVWFFIKLLASVIILWLWKFDFKLKWSFLLFQYAYQVPKLYKSLLDFYDLFKQLEAFRLNFPDDPYNTYKRKRKEILKRTIGHLYSTIQEVKDSMFDVKLNVSLTDRKKSGLSHLNLDVDSTQCFRNDYLAFRAYYNMLQNWYLELRCKGEKHVTDIICKQHFRKLSRKRDRKKPNLTKRRGLVT